MQAAMRGEPDRDRCSPLVPVCPLIILARGASVPLSTMKNHICRILRVFSHIKTSTKSQLKTNVNQSITYKYSLKIIDLVVGLRFAHYSATELQVLVI